MEGNIAKAVHSGPTKRNNSTLKNQAYSAVVIKFGRYEGPFPTLGTPEHIVMCHTGI